MAGTSLVATTPDGFDLAVQVTGPEDGPVLLLLPGQANNHTWWDGLRHGFDDMFCTVTFDYRGTGDSLGPVVDWTTSSFAADAVAVLAALGVGSAEVYATSMGGRVAQMLAIEHPDRVGRLVLACTSPGGPHAVERSAAVRRSLMQSDSAERRQALRDLFYTPALPRAAEQRRLLGDPMMTADSTRAHLRVSARHDAWDRLAEVAAPTLVLHGTDDLMVPVANAAAIVDRIPGARLHLHEGGRHGFFAEFEHDVTPLVREFLVGPQDTTR